MTTEIAKVRGYKHEAPRTLRTSLLALGLDEKISKEVMKLDTDEIGYIAHDLYRKQARQYHPDLNTKDKELNEEMMIYINNLYGKVKKLLKSHYKRNYDDVFYHITDRF